MDSVGNRFKDFLGERRTSPMYKAFILSWCLWNWQIIYILLFEDGVMIFEKYSMLKLEYIRYIYQHGYINFLGLTESIYFVVIFPILSVFVYYFLLNKLELVIREQYNKNIIRQKETDKILKQEEITEQILKAQEQEEILKGIQIKLAKTNTEIELQKREIEKNKKNDNSIEERNQDLIKEREVEYGEIKEIEEFYNAMNGLKEIISNPYPSDEIFTNYGYLYQIYNLYINGTITDKGKFFLKRFLLQYPPKNINLQGNLYDKKDELPF